MNLVINSTFRPFTYDEMVKPLVQYKEAYDKLEQDYSDLTAQTEMWKDIVNQTNSPEAYAMYQRYSNDLSAVTESFSKGMNLNNRRALLGMKRRYAQDITPIAQADAAMKAANEFRAKMGPDAIFQVGEYTSLDKFLHGKTANNKYQSREALTKKTAAMTEAAMAEALKDPEFQKAMGDQYWLITQHTGGSYAELMEAMKLGMLDNPIAQNKFSEIRQRVAKQAGVSDYDYQGQQAIMDAIDTGLYAGLDKPVRSFQANQDHITPAQRHSMNIQSESLRLSAAQHGMEKDSNGNWVYNPKKDPTIQKAEEKSKRVGDTGEGGAYVANDVIYEYDRGTSKYSVPNDMKNDMSKAHGYLTAYKDLSKTEKQIVDNHIKDSDPSQYEIYTWVPTKDGERDDSKFRVQIVRKQSPVKKGEDNAPYQDVEDYIINSYLDG